MATHIQSNNCLLLKRLDEIIEKFKNQQHHIDETVRYEVCSEIQETAKCDHEIVFKSEELMTIVKELTMDEKFSIRKISMNTLVFIYAKHSHKDVSDAKKREVDWIKNCVVSTDR